MALKDTITDDMKAAMRAKDAPRLGAIRMLLAAIQHREKADGRANLDDAQTTAVVEKMVKQRRDSIEQYEKAGRDDLAQAERDEMAIYQAYMPAQASDDDIAAAVARAIAESGATGLADIGKVMGVLKASLAGKADMGKVSAQVRVALK